MEDNNILSGDVNRLKLYKSLQSELRTAKEQNEQAVAEAKRLEKEISFNKKELKDNIDSTIKRRRGEISEKFDEEIDKVQDKLKKVKGKREKAKDKGVKERIVEETLELRNQNEELKTNIKKNLKAEKLPRFCGNGFYFTLFFTKGAGEVFVCALMILLMFLILPAAVYALCFMRIVPEKYSILVFALTYFVVLTLLFFIYKIIGDKTKHKHLDALRGIRILRDQINGNKRQIKAIANSIKKDKNEDAYALGDFDTKINEFNSEIESIKAEKNSALESFDGVTANDITEEINKRELPRINEMEERLNQNLAAQASYEETIKQIGIRISTEYEAYIGKEFTNEEKLDQLIAIMETGKATTVSEAINVLKTQGMPE